MMILNAKKRPRANQEMLTSVSVQFTRAQRFLELKKYFNKIYSMENDRNIHDEIVYLNTVENAIIDVEQDKTTYLPRYSFQNKI